jgi:hypothetical protein
MNSDMRFKVLRVAIVGMLSAIACAGCKRSNESTSSTNGGGGRSTASGDGTAGGATATGAGAVNVVGNVVTYQNVHVRVPWNASDVADVVRMSREAATGAGLTLKGGKWTILIASDGRSLKLNGRDCGELKEGDWVVLSADGKLTVNDVVRSAGSGPATTQKVGSAHGNGHIG